MTSSLIREVADDDEHHRAGQNGNEGIGEELQHEGLHQHEGADGDQDGRQVFPGPAAQTQEGVPTQGGVLDLLGGTEEAEPDTPAVPTE